MLRPEPQSSAATGRSAWLDHVLLALALTLLLSGFRDVIEGTDWWVTTVLVAMTTGLTCAVLRAIGVRWVTPFALVVELVLITWVFVPETLVAIVPTPDTVRGLADLSRAAREIIVVEQAPVAPAKAVVLVLAASFGLIVIVADLLLQRRFAAHGVGLLLAAVFVTPALISGSTPSPWLFVVVAAIWLVLLRSRTAPVTTGSRRRTSPALVLGAASLAVALVFPVLSPNISAVAASWGSPPPSVFGRGINPMLELGQNLRRSSPVTALSYTTTLDQPPYLKVATLRNFTGKTWKPGRFGRADVAEGRSGVSSRFKVDTGVTKITVDRLKSDLLPLPYPVEGQVEGLKGDWRLQPFGLTLTSDDATTSGQKYAATSLVVEPTANQMRGLSSRLSLGQDANVALPADTPAIIGRMAREVTKDATNDYDRAIALQEWFRSDGGFTYSETAPVADGYDGNGVDVIAEFLQKKAGYCVHFSSAMAVMARTLDIPSRIAVGYAPGNVASVKDGTNTYEVTSDNLHAWTELYFDTVGWVRFDPTTGVGSANTFREPNADSTPSDSADTPQRENAQDRPDTQGRDSAAPTAAPTTTGSAPRTAIATLAGLAVLAATPAVVRALRRRWRLRQGMSSVDPLWRELEDAARDHGIAFSTADTPRGFAARLRSRPHLDGEALDRLLRRVETSRFARATEQDGDGVDDLRAVLASLRLDASRVETWRATALPRSLAGRRTYVVRTPEAPLPAT